MAKDESRSDRMLRISEVNVSDGATTLRLEGRVVGPWVLEARRSCEKFLAEGRRLTLDLAEVSFADREAIVLLQDLMGRQVAFVNCSPFLTEQLKNYVS
jgi:ABC-type transporter Mla MlaB component